MKSTHTAWFATASLGAAVLLLACGENKLERGLTPPGEAAAPESAREMEMTEEQRRKQEEREEARKERAAFEAEQ
jgi:hypothetical protein